MCRLGRRVKKKLEKKEIQIDQSRFSDISCDKLGSERDGGEQEGKVAGGCRAQAKLVAQNVANEAENDVRNCDMRYG